VAKNKRDGSAGRRHLQVVTEEPRTEVDVAFDIQPIDLIAGLYANLARDVGKVRNPLDAELGVAEWLAMITTMIGTRIPSESQSEAIAHFLVALIDEARSAKTTQALALLRALSALPGTPAAEAADTAAAELAAAGVADRPWVTTMTRLEPTSCLRYGHVDGSQESLILGFRYGKSEHAISVLIDHDLGGGVKDCWLTDEPDVIRERILAMGRLDPLIEVGPVDWVSAERILAEALSRPTCASDADQISDTQAYLPLLRRRVELLRGHPWLPTGLVPRQVAPRATTQDTLFDAPAPEPGPIPGAAARTTPKQPIRRSAAAAGALVLKVSLYGARPPIWRRLLVSDTITLERLHTVIQVAFGWTDTHLHLFTVGNEDYGPNDGWTDAQSERIRLTRIADVGDKIDYVYDFGDDWRHTILLEKRLQERGRVAPRCLTGRRAVPPEDCGGIGGYQELLSMIANPDADPEMLVWAADALGTDVPGLRHYDPSRFDAEEVSRLLGAR
jgi:Plasmid pRiA4b ORF-3-like protein